MDKVSNSSNESEFKSVNVIDLNDKKEKVNGQLINLEIKKDKLNLKDMDLKNNLKPDLNEKERIDGVINEVLDNDLSKSTDELTNGQKKILNMKENFKSDGDESSKYESLSNSSLNLEPIDKKTNSHQEFDKQNQDNKEVTDQKEPNEPSQLNDEFVNLFGNPDLSKRIIKKGDESSLKPERGCEVLINIEVRNYETNELIESESEQNLTILVGDFDVLHGVDLALVTMHKGEIAEILVNPLVGYGPKGKLPLIPSNCILICKVELLKIKWPNEMVCENMDTLLRYFNLCKRKKERGNFFFKREEYETSLSCYTKSGQILDMLGQEMVNRHHFLTSIEDKVPNEDRKKEIADELNNINELSIEYMKIKLDVFNNLSAVNIKMESYNQALDAAENALRVNPNDLKALYRKSQILKLKGYIEDAINCLKQALRIDPKNKTFIAELNKLKIKRKKEIIEERALYEKMLQPKKIEEKINKMSNSKQSLNYLTTGLVISGVLLGSYILYRKYAKS